MPKRTREQKRNERAEALCREVRYQIANNRLEGDRLFKFLDAWMRVAKKNKYVRPK